MSPETPADALCSRCGVIREFPDEACECGSPPMQPNHAGCDCTELCSMGPTCPGGMLARLPGSGCWRTSAPETPAGTWAHCEDPACPTSAEFPAHAHRASAPETPAGGLTTAEFNAHGDNAGRFPYAEKVFSEAEVVSIADARVAAAVVQAHAEDTDRQGLGSLITRLLDEHWPNSGVNGWYLADLIREHYDVARTEDRARIEAVEALHTRSTVGPWCGHDGQDLPCATLRAALAATEDGDTPPS